MKSAAERKILITGTTGLVGRGIAEHFLERGWQVTGAGRKPQGFPQNHYRIADLTMGPDISSELLLGLEGAVVIHCAGSKDVRWCESNPDAAHLVNAMATQWLADAAKQAGSKFIYLSTDLVFPCDLGGFSENDRTGSPLIYGKTKAAGEALALKVNPETIVCRTSGVFGENSPTMRWLATELGSGKGVEAYSDVINSPTYLPDLAVMLEKVITGHLRGIFHTSGEEVLSRLEWFREFAKIMGIDEKLVRSAKAEGRFQELLLLPNSSLHAEATYVALGMRPRAVSEAFAEMKLRAQK